MDDGQVHFIDYPVGDGGRGMYRVSGSTTVELLEGAWGQANVSDHSVLNIRGGQIGPVSGQGSTQLRDNAQANFYSGALHRRFINLTDQAALTFHGTGQFEHLDSIALRSGSPTLTFYLDPAHSKREDITIKTERFIGSLWTTDEEYMDEAGKIHREFNTPKESWRVHTRVMISVTLPGAQQPQRFTISVWEGNKLRNDEGGATDTANPPRTFYGLNEAFINFDGTVKPGHINFVPADKTPASAPRTR